MRFSWPHGLAVLAPTVLFALASTAAPSPAQRLPARLHANPLRARQARQLAARAFFPSPLDGGDEPEADAGGTNVEGYQFWWIGAVSPSDLSMPNSGVQSLLQEIDAPPAGSGCFDCWTSEYLDNGMWGQIGFASCRMPGFAPSTVTFYQIWDTNASPEALLVDASSQVTSPGIHSYAMNVLSGTVWAYSVDGAIFGSYDMGSATSSNPGALGTMCEEGDGVTAAFTPPGVAAPVAMSVFNGGAWTGAPAGNVFNSANLSGVSGSLQNSAFSPGSIVIGGDSPDDSSGTALWDGPSPGFAPDAGPAGTSPLAPPLLALTSPAANAIVSGTVAITGTAACSMGMPKIDEVEFFAEDLEGHRNSHEIVKAVPFGMSWDTSRLPSGPYLVFMEVVDVLGRQTYVDVQVTVNNPPARTSTSGTGTAGASGTLGTGTGTNSFTGGPVWRAGSTSGGSATSGTTDAASPAVASGCNTGAGGLSPLLALLPFAGRRSRGGRRLG